MTRIRTALVALCISGPACANESHRELIAFGRTQAAHIAARADVIEQVIAQNHSHAGLSDQDIERQDLLWQKQFGSPDAPLIHTLLNRPLSDDLRTLQLRSNELITEIIIMDNRGLNVALSSVTSDYWQGDEAKWQNTFLEGPGAEHIGPPGKDDSTGTVQIQISRTIRDSTGHAIGAVTVGVAAMQF